MSNLEGRIPYDRSVIVAADVEADLLDQLIRSTYEVKGIGGYKVGLQLALTMGLPNTISAIKDFTSLPIIYDHQKAGTDIPPTGGTFAKICRQARVDAAILFPFGGAETQQEWTKALQDAGVGVLVGGHMTQRKFLWKEGGVVHDEGPARIFEAAARQGVTDFVLPGNKPEEVARYMTLLNGVLGEGNFSVYAPGFITQGGDISAMAQVAGPNWHAIVGSGIYGKVNIDDMNAAARMVTSQIAS